MDNSTINEHLKTTKMSASMIVKTGLVILFLSGLCMSFMGYQGKKVFDTSGFSAENSYYSIYELSRDVSQIWEKEILSSVNQLAPEEKESLNHVSDVLLADELGEEIHTDNREYRYKLLYTSYLFGGPKLSTSERKRITSENHPQELRAELLRCITDESRKLPDVVKNKAEALQGTDRQEVLFQAYFTSCGASYPSLADHINQLKKAVRGKEQQLQAFKMISDGDMTWLRQFMISHNRTIILLGILLMLDAVILMLMMSADRRWSFDVKWILILLIVDFLLVFQILPLLHILLGAIFPDGSFSLCVLQRLITYPLNVEAVKNTVIASVATMILGTLLAFPLAFLIGRTNLYGRKFFRSLFVITYMVPPYVGAMAWLRLMNPNVGVINLWLRSIFHLANTPGPLNVYSLPGMIWVLTTFYYPYAFITISSAMEKMDPTLEDASRISGASPLKTIFKIDLPLMMPSLLAGALLVFVSAASCYGIPSIIGKPGNVNTITTRIVEYTSLGQKGIRDATALSVFLMALAILILLISDVVLAKKQYITVSGKSVTPTLIHLRSFRWPLTILVSLFAAVVIVLPFMTILLTSFKTDVGKSILAAGNFTTANWITVFARTETMHCLKNSLLFACAAASAGIVISTVMNYLQLRTQLRGRSVPAFLITLGSGTPSVVIALGLIMTMRGNYGINIYGTSVIMIIAYLIKHLMMGMRTVSSSMSQVHSSLEECSQISGASWLRTMWKITGPLIFPSIAAGWFLIFIPSFYELSMTTLLYSGTTKTIGFQLYEYWTFTSQPMSCAMAIGILLFVVVLNFLLGRITKGRFSI
ncbi:MAG: iron ABC transporter permease [Solobacterium sp.]|nr:iron ABC transporter permease [Solobacterium sp.]